MPRTARAGTGGICCHVLNRGNAAGVVFHDEDDYAGFVELLGAAVERTPIRVLAWCLMPNHFHMVVQPQADGDLGRWMQWLMTSHVRRYHSRRGTSGHVWQGRFKSFPLQRRRPRRAARARGVVETGDPLRQVVRYVERNPLRAKLVARAEDWPWSSLRYALGLEALPEWVAASWLDRPAGWAKYVNRPASDAELAALQQSVMRGAPFGQPAWVTRIARQLGLESTLRPRGRPRKDANTGARRSKK